MAPAEELLIWKKKKTDKTILKWCDKYLDSEYYKGAFGKGEAWGDINRKLFKKFYGWGYTSSVIVCLPSKHETLSWNPSSAKKKKKRKKKKEKKNSISGKSCKGRVPQVDEKMWYSLLIQSLDVRDRKFWI
jgi:hypothetical protein